MIIFRFVTHLEFIYYLLSMNYDMNEVDIIVVAESFTLNERF